LAILQVSRSDERQYIQYSRAGHSVWTRAARDSPKRPPRPSRRN